MSVGGSQRPATDGLEAIRAEGLAVFTPRHAPPTQAELTKEAAARGGLRRAQQEPFYGDPAHAPNRSVRSAGLEFRVGTAAVSELPPFSSDGQSGLAMAAVVAAAGLQQPSEGDSWFEFAVRPPSRAETDAWLRDRRLQRHGPNQSVGTADPGFIMDTNTGQLVVPMAAVDSQATSGGSANYRSSPADACAPDSAIKVDAGGQAEEEAEEEYRPPSPKYDEKNFFMSSVQHPWVVRTQRRASGSRSPIRPRQQVSTPRTPVLGATTNAAGPAVAVHRRLQPVPEGGVSDRPPGRVVAGAASVSPLKRRRLGSQISPAGIGGGDASPVPLSQAGFKRVVPGKGQQLTLLSVEIQADCRGRLLPDPRYDAVRCIALSAQDDGEDVPDGLFLTRVLLNCGEGLAGRPLDGLYGIQVDAVATEAELFELFVEAVRALDPDILVGYDVQKGSFGYLLERAGTLDDVNLTRLLSRTPEERGSKEGRSNEYDELHASGITISGRLTLNLWRLLRGELKLGIYTQEATAAAVLQRRQPRIPPQQASVWFKAGSAGGRWRTVGDCVRRARTNLAIMDQLDLVGRTGETARAFGIDFLAVLHRGSQYRVESLMARLAHSQNYLLPSPSKEQVGTQPAMEAIPLVMEPESRFYAGPVVVLDFQSLYPSQIIAYNLCFSTCLGRPAHAMAGNDPGSTPPRLGALDLALPPGTLTGGLKPSELIIAPNGVAFTPPSVRPGVLPRMLSEILATRIMVKAAMKRTPAAARVLQRVLNARQFCLKLIANVTYGYAAAGFSGRMPMAELADAIVQSGRETLENAIRKVNEKPEWAARVVYGDTDSLFVHLPGRSRQEAFRIGAEIAAEVTAVNPPPVALKLEKVYEPCVLLTKKRYVGYMYESPSQATPTFDAKGIETVRRDGCPAVVKIMERMLRTLFETRDLSVVRSYLQRQWAKILAGRVSLEDFVFAKEVRLGTYKAAPPAACVAARLAQEDPRAEPAFGERVPYLVVCGAPSSRLMDVVVAPRVLLDSGGRLRLNAQYYITKQINAALARVLQLVGVDVNAWFATMARPQRRPPQKRPPPASVRRNAGTIDRFYLSSHCVVCDSLTRSGAALCGSCRGQPQLAVAVLHARAAALHAALSRLVQVCRHCEGGGGRPPCGGVAAGRVACDSLDCSLFFDRRKAELEGATCASQLAAALKVVPQ